MVATIQSSNFHILCQKITLYLFLLFVYILTACTNQPQLTLYQRLGGEQVLNSTVDNLLYNIAEQPVLLAHFNGVDIDRFRENLIIHLCDISDGPCTYQGDSMSQIHRGMNITAAEFDTLVTCLFAAMDEAGVAFTAQNELVGRLAPLRKDIVL